MHLEVESRGSHRGSFGEVWLKILRKDEMGMVNDKWIPSIDSVSALITTSVEGLFCPLIQLKVCSKNKKPPAVLPLYQGPAAAGKKKLINLCHKAWKKDGFFQESQEFWCVRCCKLKPGPGCLRAKGWCHRVVLGDKNRNYKCWKSQTGACVESPVTPPFVLHAVGHMAHWVTSVSSNSFVQHLSPEGPWSPGRERHLNVPPPLHFNTLFNLHIACGLGANTTLIFVILLLTA